MNIMKKIIATALVALMAVTVVGCHPKNETAVTINGEKFTSAYYMCALIYADTEARSKVDEAKSSDSSDSSDSSESTSSTSSETDYYSEKVEDTDFVDWVKKQALESLKKIAAYKIKCKEADLTLDEDTESSAKQYASYYWSNYGYSQMFEPNGVGQQTYTQYMLDSYYSNLYFEHVYGKDGEKEIAADEVTAKTMENFILVNKLEASFSNKSDEEKAQLTAQFNGYLTDLQNGTRTFDEIYKEYNNATDDAASESETDTDEVKPVNKNAGIFGTADTSYASDYYDTAKAMATGEVKLIEEENSAGLMLVVKLDLASDQYYVDNLDLSSRHLIKDDEYEEDMQKYADTLECETEKYAINQFKVKKITYPQSNTSAS